jgi:cytochrome c5
MKPPLSFPAAVGLLLFALGAAVVGCYPKAGPAPGPVSANGVTSASTRWPGATAASLAAGHDLFLAKCNGCHAYPDLAAVRNEEWQGIVESMGKKSHLDADQRAEVLQFVLAKRSEHEGGG